VAMEIGAFYWCKSGSDDDNGFVWTIGQLTAVVDGIPLFDVIGSDMGEAAIDKYFTVGPKIGNGPVLQEN
jgi:hypothetical protein